MGLLAISMVLGCSAKDDTVQIRELIQKGTTLAQDHQIGDLVDLSTNDFIAYPGRHDRRSVKGVLFAAFRHYGQFKIHFPRPAVEIGTDEQQANATVYFIIVSQSRELPGLKELYDDPRQWLAAAGEKADLYQLKLQLLKKEGDWLVKQADLEGFKGTGF